MIGEMAAGEQNNAGHARAGDVIRKMFCEGCGHRKEVSGEVVVAICRHCFIEMVPDPREARRWE